MRDEQALSAEGSRERDDDPDLQPVKPEDEELIAWLSRGPHKPPSQAFTDRVMDTIREREKEKQRENEKQKGNGGG